MQNGLILDNSVMLTIGKVNVGLFLDQRVLQQAVVQSFLSARKHSGKRRRMSLASNQQQWGSAQRPGFSIAIQNANLISSRTGWQTRQLHLSEKSNQNVKTSPCVCAFQMCSDDWRPLGHIFTHNAQHVRPRLIFNSLSKTLKTNCLNLESSKHLGYECACILSGSKVNLRGKQ